MNPHLAQTIATYESKGLDFSAILDWHLQHGIVICDDAAFGLAYYADSKSPRVAVLRHQADTIFITYYTGDMGRWVIPYADEYDFLSFSRSFQGSPRIRLLSMEKFRAKSKI